MELICKFGCSASFLSYLMCMFYQLWTSALRDHFAILSHGFCFRYKPDIIKGDMDSVRQEVKDFYANMVS